MSRALAASLLTAAVLLLFFDGLSFPMSAGLIFFLSGLCGALRTIAASDDLLVRDLGRVSRAEPEDSVSGEGVRPSSIAARDPAFRFATARSEDT